VSPLRSATALQNRAPFPFVFHLWASVAKTLLDSGAKII
jgi:hypothetical protein